MSIHPAPPDRGRRAVTLPVVGLLALVLVALVGAACSGGGSGGQGVVSLDDPSASPDPSSSAAASQDPEEAMLAFQQCMRDHGVDVQLSSADAGSGGKIGVDIQVGPSNDKADKAQPGSAPDRQKIQAADEACHHLLPQGGRADPNRTMDPQLQDQLLAFAQCMRDHGIDFPDPQFDANGGRVTIGSADGGTDGLDPSSPTFQAAQQACSASLPGGAPFKVGTGPADGGEVKP